MAEDINDFIQRAVVVARSLLAQGIDLATQGSDAVSGQVQEAAEDLIEDTKASRDAMVTLVRSEIDRAVGRLGLVREDELAALRRHVDRLERQVAELREAAAAAVVSAKPPVKKASAKPTATKAAAKSAARGSTATKAAVTPAGRRSPGTTAQGTAPSGPGRAR